MVKKVVVGALLVGLSGILILGAVRRTQDKTGTESGEGQGRGQRAESVQGDEGERARNGQQSTSGAAGGLGESTAGNWVTREGSVATCDGSILTIAAAGDESWEIGGRAWSYAQEQGFAVNPGDQVTVRGFYEDDEFKPAQLENRTTGQAVMLRDEAGRPMWSGGRGRRNT